MVRVALRDAPHSRKLVSGARCSAYRTVRRVFGEDAFADRAFRAEAERDSLAPRDRAFAQQLAYGTVQRRETLDYVLSAIASRPVKSIDPALRDVLRMGIYQLVYLDGVPDHAAVNETVQMARQECGRGHRFANALMRRAAREGRDLVAELTSSTPTEAAVAHSHPEWLVRMWWDLLGPEQTLELLQRDNAAPESAVRANELALTVSELGRLLAQARVASHPAPLVPEGLVLDSPYDLHGSPLFAAGALMPQSRASMLAARVLSPRRGERVLDMCAAPGAKTTHVAALMGGTGEVVALERNAGRAEGLEETCRRLGAARVRVIVGDAALDAPPGPFDRVLLDPPCSDLGTLQARPDVRWRKSPEQIESLGQVQRELLEAAAPRVAEGGVLLYSTCTISPRENEEQMHEFLAAHGEFQADDLSATYPELRHRAAPRFLQLLPHRHDTDGFFIARLRRRAAR